MSKNILMIGRKLDPYPPFNDGVKNATISLAEAVARKGVSVHVLAFSKTLDGFARRKEMNGVKYLSVNRRRIPQRLLHLLFPAQKEFERFLVNTICRLARIDAVYMHGCYLNIKGKIVVHIYTHNFFNQPISIPRGVLIFAENESIAERARTQYPNNEVRVVYPGVVIQKFTPKKKKNPGKPSRFLFASSPLPEHNDLEREKEILRSRGVFDIINLGIALAEKSDIQITLLWRKDAFYIKSLVRDYSFIHVETRYIEDMNRYLEDYDFCFFLFRDDANVKALPHSMIETMAKGIIPIAFKQTPLGDLLENNHAGLTVHSPFQERDIENIISLLNISDYYLTLSRNAVRMTSKFFNIDATAKEIISWLIA